MLFIMQTHEIHQIKLARKCCDYQNIKCNKENCINKLCPLNKFWEDKIKERNLGCCQDLQF
jgi:hypothetical protein